MFSGIDATATEKIASRLFEANGLFRNMGTTVVLATHSSKLILAFRIKLVCSISNQSPFFAGLLLPYADQIVVLADGRIVEKGILEDLKASSTYIQDMKVKSLSSSDEETVESDEKVSSPGFSPVIGGDGEEEACSDTPESTLNELSDDDINRQKGDYSDYTYYLRVTGFPVVVGFLGAVAFWAFCRQFPSTSFDALFPIGIQYSTGYSSY